MLDLERLEKLRLYRIPPGQVLFAEGALRLDYALPKRTEIILEGVENLPRDRGVFLAMNHTDRFNYWPLQYAMYRRGLRFTATWVKGKYYENDWMGRFMDSMNNIPLPSRGYIITTLFRASIGRTPSESEYRSLRNLVDGVATQGEGKDEEAVQRLYASKGDGSAAGFLAWFDGYFGQMIDHVVRLNRKALGEKKLNVLVFPQGTRSVRLSRGHTGLIQMAWHLGAAVVPVGCSGSDHVYPGNSPFAKGGRIVYRFGPALEVDGPEFAPLRVREPFQPLTREATELHGAAFQAATDLVMQRIETLVDAPYRFAEDLVAESDERGVGRFV